MLCLTIERFLCYWTLEIGGLVLGYLTAFGFFLTFSVLWAFVFFSWFLGGVIQPSENMWHKIYLMMDNNWYFFMYLIYCFAMAIAGIQLIRGTRKQKHNHMKPFLLYILMGAVMSPIFATHVIADVSIMAILVTLIVVTHVYAFICVLSLHEKVRRSSNYESL